jgi:ELWxxDGT repeat protein
MVNLPDWERNAVMPLVSIFGRNKKRAAKETSRRPKRAVSPRAAVVRRNFETLEDRSLLTATYLPINPVGAANPTNFASLGGQALFAASDGSTGVELWKSDGTVSGTALVKDINPGSTLTGGVSTFNSSNPTDLVAAGGYVYFAANDGADGAQLWKSDGTAAGTTMVTSGNLSGGGMNPANLADVGGKLFFTANDGSDGNQVWTTDGTAPGTLMVSNLQPSTGTANPSQLTAVGGTLYFTANTSSGVQLYRADGVPADTRQVSNVTNGTIGASPTSLTNVNGTLFYAGYDSVHGNQLWQSNGTTGSTTIVATIGSGVSSSNPTNLTSVGGTVYFAANDGTHGVQLWKSDGTAGGTTMVVDLNTTAAGASANPSDLTEVGGVLYFRANDGVHGTQLWRSDGTASGTTMVAAINSGSVGSTPDNLVSANGFLFFTANDGTHGFELWQSDGKASGTKLLADINPGAPSSNPMFLTAAGNHLLVAANDGTHGVSLYGSDIPALRPTLPNSSYLYTPGQALVVAGPGVLSGATASPGATLSAVLVSPPTQGALTLNSDGSFTYLPNAGFRGNDSFTVNVSDGTSTAAHAATVTIQSLDARWVANLYTDILGRAAGATSDSEINYWVDQLAAGATRSQISDVFLRSGEYFARLVQNDFQQILQRDADPDSLSYFVGELEQGGSSATVLVQILSSSEFLNLSGSTNGFVSNLYGALLGRLPTGGEFSYWVAQLNGGVSTQEMSSIFLVSTEYRELVIDSLYQQFLHRPADPDAVQFWLAQLAAGQSFGALESALAASSEFYT